MRPRFPSACKRRFPGPLPTVRQLPPVLFFCETLKLVTDVPTDELQPICTCLRAEISPLEGGSCTWILAPTFAQSLRKTDDSILSNLSAVIDVSSALALLQATSPQSFLKRRRYPHAEIRHPHTSTYDDWNLIHATHPRTPVPVSGLAPPSVRITSSHSNSFGVLENIPVSENCANMDVD